MEGSARVVAPVARTFQSTRHESSLGSRGAVPTRLRRRRSHGAEDRPPRPHARERFWRPRGYVVALTYGPNSDWARNVLAAGGCALETRGRTVRLTQPRLYHDEQRRAVPLALRVIGRLGHIADFLDLTTEDGGGLHRSEGPER